MFNHKAMEQTAAAGAFYVLLNGKKTGFTGIRGNSEGLEWEINHARHDLRSEISLTLTNRTGQPVSIGDITLFSYKEDDIEGNLPDRIIYDFRNFLGNCYVVHVTESGGKFDNCPMFMVTDGRRIQLAAQLTFQFNEVHFRSCFQSSGKLESVTCELPSLPYQLQPGASLTTDTVGIYHFEGYDPLDALHYWANDVKAINRPRLPAETWGGLGPGTLIHDREKYTQERKTLEQIGNVGNLPELGLKYYWISIANILGMLPGNWLYPDPGNFPGGLGRILKKIQDAGLVPGFWLNPFAIAENSRDFKKMEPYLIRKQDGTPASRGKWEHTAPDEHGNLPNLYALDPAFPEVFEYIKNVLQTYASWGIRYYMIDFLAQGRYRAGEKASGYALENYIRFLRKLQEYAAPDTHFLAATGASVIHIGAISSSRIGMDYCEGRPLYKHWPSYPADYVIGGSLYSAGAPHRNAVNNMAMWEFADQNFFRCNSNMMTVDKPIPLKEARITTSLYGISSSPVFYGDYLKLVDPERLALIKKTLPRGSSMPLPVDLFTKTDLEQDFVRVFRLEVSKPWGTYYICAVFNLNDRIRTLTLSDRFLRIPAGRTYVMYDFWNEEYLGTANKEFSVDVPGQTALILRLEERKDHPWLLSTDFTVRQGDSEIESMEWDPVRLCLKGIARRAAGEEGNLFFIAPDGFKVVDFNRGFRVMKSAVDMSLIIKKHLKFEEARNPFEIRFERWEGTDPRFQIEK